jgi:hypothetical protein
LGVAGRGRHRGNEVGWESGYMQETHVLDKLIIKLLFFIAKAGKIFDFRIKHRDLNPIESTSNCQKALSIWPAF